MMVRPPVNPNLRTTISVLDPDNGRVQSDGSFEVKGVLSDTVLSIAPLTGGWTLKAIEREGRDVADLPLPIEHGKTLSGIRVVLTRRPTITVPSAGFCFSSRSAAVDDVQDGQWYDSDFLADLRHRAQRLSLAHAEHTRIDLTLQK
jgi:hypothetical protein